MAELFWQFLLYSFLGFLLEVLFARLTRSPKQDRKCFLLLPLCPVYGLGAMFILHLPAAIQNHFLLLFLLGSLTATAAEYCVDWLCETFLTVRFWDYSGLLWNLNGRISLLFSGFWGLLALVLVTWVHPFFVPMVAAIPSNWFLPGVLLFLIDGLVSVFLLRANGTTDILRWYDRLPIAKKRANG